MTSGPFLWSGAADRARTTPDATAVSAADGELTYRELDRLANGLAHTLHRDGIGAGDRVGVYAPKGRATLASLLGILKAGASYVPVDPQAPVRRAATVLSDAGLAGLVVSGRTREALTALAGEFEFPATVIRVPVPGSPEEPAAAASDIAWSSIEPAEDPPETEIDPESTAYILYTSGSTGRPKGVVHSHRSARAFVDWAVHTFGLEPEDRLSNHASLTFDLSVLDIFAAWSSGACVFPVPSRIRPFPAALAGWIAEKRITVWYSVPSALTQITNARGETDLGCVRTVLYAGEAFPPDRLVASMEAFQEAEFHNLFGPTETNVCTHFALPRPWPTDREVPIGVACCGDRAHLAEPEDPSLCEEGEGELVICGPTVMSGYWRSGALDTSPLEPPVEGAAFPTYRTGDMVRVDDQGRLVFLGRRDGMVKTRGYRVELGEVESVLLAHSQVDEAVVVAVPDPEAGSVLAAFVVSGGEPLDEGGLRGSLGERLPRHAVPRLLVPVDSIPLTQRGKRDRQALRKRAVDILSEN